MANLTKALADIAEVLFPLTGELPMEAEQFATAEEAAVWLDKQLRLRGVTADFPDRPCVGVVYRGSYREPVFLLHGYEFLRLLKRSEYDL